jgi:YkoY family integral membrane protein
LVVLEGVLSIDNALVLGLLARRLPHSQQGKALSYGLIGALVFRLIAVAAAAYLLHWRIVKLLGGGYLLYVAIKHFFFHSKRSAHKPLKPASTFWPTVLAIELTDVAFAIDSIVAAIGIVGPAPDPQEKIHPKLWVILTGGMLGVVLMRFAAVIFIRLLEKFPRFELSAYLLVIVIGIKLVVEWAVNTHEHPHRLNFQDAGSAAFWIFWMIMLACFAVGFIPAKQENSVGINQP